MDRKHPDETKYKQYSKIFIGELIRQKVEERNLSYTEFARMINCSRTSLYSLFSKKSIDVELLLVISDVLCYDFIDEVYRHRPAPLGGVFLDSSTLDSITEEITGLLRRRLGRNEN